MGLKSRSEGGTSVVLKFGEDYSQELDTIFHNSCCAETVAHFLCSLAIFARQSGFRDGLDDWGKFKMQTPDLQGSIDLMPYGNLGVCGELLMAFSKGESEFDSRLREAHDRCAINCRGITKGVLLVTDFWDNEKFWDIQATTFEKLSVENGVVLAAAIWTGNFFAVQRIIPQYI